MRKTHTAGTVRRRVGIAAIGAAALAAVAVPGAAWADDDAVSPVAQDHSVTVAADNEADFREARVATSGPVEVSPEAFQKMIADGQFVPAGEGDAPRPDSVTVTIDKYGNTEVREVSPEELERMKADGEFVPATPLG
nr:hypothetical protein OHB51_35710 [Micromonospora sp. NBC_00855]